MLTSNPRGLLGMSGQISATCVVLLMPPRHTQSSLGGCIRQSPASCVQKACMSDIEVQETPLQQSVETQCADNRWTDSDAQLSIENHTEEDAVSAEQRQVGLSGLCQFWVIGSKGLGAESLGLHDAMRGAAAGTALKLSCPQHLSLSHSVCVLCFSGRHISR